MENMNAPRVDVAPRPTDKPLENVEYGDVVLGQHFDDLPRYDDPTGSQSV
jgi:hypothetical protein